MIIVIGGRAGSGKSTIAKLIAEKLKLKHYSMGDLQRQIAQEKGISLVELGKLEEKDSSIDKMLDEKQKKLGETQDNFVIDGRLSAFFIPNAIKIFLDADENVRAERILKDNRNLEKSSEISKMVEELKKREESEQKRYKNYYNFEAYDKSKYDLVIDTTNKKPEEIVREILDFVENKKFR